MFLRNLTLCALIASTSLHASHVLQKPDPTTLGAKVASDAAVKSQRSETHHTNVLQAIITFIHTCAIPIGATGATAIPATLSDARKVQQAEQQRAAQQALQQSLNNRNNTKSSMYSRPR